MSARCKDCEAIVPFDEWLCVDCARNVVARYAKPADPPTDWEALIANGGE